MYPCLYFVNNLNDQDVTFIPTVWKSDTSIDWYDTEWDLEWDTWDEDDVDVDMARAGRI